MIEHLPKLMEAGVDSFKIEGRMKSQYYVATVVNAYRRALDIYEKGEKLPKELIEELTKASHRKYTTGFYNPNNQKEEREYTKTSMPVQKSEFIGIVTKDAENGTVEIEMRNRFVVGDEVEVLSPDANFNKKFKITSIKNIDGEEIDDAKGVQEKYVINCPFKLKQFDILRK